MENNETMPKKNPLSMQIDLSKFEKATDEEKAQQDVMSESTTFFKDGMRRLMKNQGYFICNSVKWKCLKKIKNNC